MTKAYSEDFRKCVVEHYNNGAPRKEVLSIFKIGANTLTRWIREYRETKSYSVKKREHYKERKIDDDKLLAYIKEKPSALLREIAKDYSVTPQAVSYRFKILGISRKKKHFYIKNAMKKKEKNSSKNY
jgi:putative transposase